MEIRTLNQALDAINTSVDACNKANTEGKLEAFNNSIADLKDAVKDFNKISQNTTFNLCAAAEKPFELLVQTFTYNGRKVEIEYEKDEDGKNTSKILHVSAVECQKRLNLGAFLTFTKQSPEVRKGMVRVYKALVARKKKFFEMSPVEWKATYESSDDFTKALMKQMKKDGFPTSNTQMYKLMQEALNSLGVEKRIVHWDMLFLDTCLCKADKSEACAMKPITEAQFIELWLDVLANKVCGKQYKIKEKAAKKAA